MKILHISPQLGKGGAEDIIVNLSSFLSEKHDVTLLLFSRYNEDQYNLSRLSTKVKVKSVIPLKLNFQSYVAKIFKILLYLFSPFISLYIFFVFRLYKFDIVHINMTMASFYLPFFKLYCTLNPLCKTKFIETFHTNTHLLKPFAKLIFRNSWNLVDHLIYEIGEFEDKNIIKYSNVKKLSFIPFGVPSPEKKDTVYLDTFCKEKNIDNKRLILMSIARLRLHEKRFDKMLLSLKILKESGTKDFLYLVCGDGPDREKIKAMVIEYDLQDNVILAGFVDNPQQLVYLADIFLVAMVGQDTGIAGLQAGMANIPLLGYQTLENYEGKQDIIYSTDDMNLLSKKIKTLIENKEFYANYNEKITNYIQNKYEISRFYNDYLELFSREANED